MQFSNNIACSKELLYKDMYIYTELVKDGKPKAVIVAPKIGYVRRLSEKVRDEIQVLTGVELKIIDDELIKGYGPDEHNWIVLGNFADNRAIEKLYLKFWTFVDREWPGRSSYTIQTIHDPIGTGKNVVLIGASDEDGLEAGVNNLLGRFEKSNSIVLGRIYDVSFGEDGPLFWRNSPIVPTQYLSGVEYLLTGDKRALGYFKEAILKDARMSIDDFKKTTFGTHLYAFGGPLLWRLLEPEPIFSQEERRVIAQHFLDFARSNEGYGYVKNINVSASISNHDSRAAIALMLLADYFKTGYKLPEADLWSDAIRRCFDYFAFTGKPMEDNNYHGYSTIDNAAIYALFTGDMRFFENGGAKRAAQRYMMLMSNRNQPVANLYLTTFFGTFLRTCAYVYNDGTYLYWEGRRDSDDFMTDQPFRRFATDIQPILPKDQVGLVIAPVDEIFFNSRNRYRPAPNIQIKDSFDKLVLREGYDYNHQHLVLDGIGRGPKTGDDANSIFEYSADGRLYLVNWNGLETSSSSHNTVAIVYNGLATSVPSFVRLESAIEMETAAYTRSTLVDYSWTDWTRHILWQKGGFFLVVDSFLAKEDGEYGITRFWRTLGEVSIDEDRFKILQKPYKSLSSDEETCFNIITLSDTERSVMSQNVSDLLISKNGASYTFAPQPLQIHNLNESINFGLKRGEESRIEALLYSESTIKPGPINAISIGNNLYKVAVYNDIYIVGIGPNFSIGDIKLQANAIYLSEERGVIFECTEVTSEGKEIFASSKPVSFEIDLLARSIREGYINEMAKVFSKEFQQVKTSEARIFEALKKESGLTDNLRSPVWSHNFGDGEIIGFANIGVAPMALTKNGKIYLLGNQGEYELFKDITSGGKPFVKNDSITSFFTVDLNGDGFEELLVGTGAGKIFAFDAYADLRWVYDAPTHPGVRYKNYVEINKSVQMIYGDDLDGDGKAELLVGTGDGYVRGLDHNGLEEWSMVPYAGIFRSATSGRLGPGPKSFIGGVGLHPRSFSLNIVYSLDKKGRETQPGWHDSRLFCIDAINEDNLSIIAGGTNDGRLWVKGLGINAWEMNLSGTVTRVYVGKVQREYRVFVASHSGYLLAFSKDGEKIWASYVGGQIQNMAPVLNADGSVLGIITGSSGGNVSGVSTEGEILWQARVDSTPTAIIGERSQVIVGTQAGSVYIFPPYNTR